MLSCIASGILVRAPQRRTASNGNPFATFLLRVALSDEDSIIANCITFHRDAVDGVMRLAEREQ